MTKIDLSSFLWRLLAVGGGGALIAYTIVKKLGENWLRSRVRVKEKQFDACLHIWNALKDAQI